MDIVEKFIRQISYKFSKGYPDMNNEHDIVLLNSLLENLGINLKEEDTQSFESFINSKVLEDKTKQTILNTLSDEEKTKILSNKSDNINQIISFLNSNNSIIRKTFNIREKDMGRGEVTLIIASSNGQKISKRGELGDVSIDGKAYELKEVGDKEPLRAGQTFRSPVATLTTTLWLLKYELFENPDAEKFKETLGEDGEDLFKRWQGFSKKVKGKPDNKNVDWTSFGKTQLPELKKFLNDLRIALVKISSNEKLKPEFVIGDKALDVSPEDLEKIKNAEVNKNISISGKVIPASADYETIQRFRGVIKTLLSGKTLNMTGDEIDADIKKSFIEEISGGLILVSPTEFKLINSEQFIQDFDFVGITQSNRPQFTLKGAKIDENEE